MRAPRLLAAALAASAALTGAASAQGGFATLAALSAAERAGLAAVAPRLAALAPRPTTPSPGLTEAELECLATAVYFEARGEPEPGRIAVAEVVLNRVEHPDYPDSVCGVVEDRRYGGCQFSWMCDGRSDEPRNLGLYARLKDLSFRVASGRAGVVTDGATHFHSDAVNPSWARRMTRTISIGAHHFYRLR